MSTGLGQAVNSLSGIGDFFINFQTNLGNALKYLFVPSEEFFNTKNTNLKNAFENKLSINTYKNIIQTWSNVVQGTFPDQYISLPALGINNVKWLDGSVISGVKSSYYGSVISGVKSSYYGLIRGVMFFFLVVYNINMIYKLIRGGDLIKPAPAPTPTSDLLSFNVDNTTYSYGRGGSKR